MTPEDSGRGGKRPIVSYETCNRLKRVATSIDPDVTKRHEPMLIAVLDHMESGEGKGENGQA